MSEATADGALVASVIADAPEVHEHHVLVGKEATKRPWRTTHQVVRPAALPTLDPGRSRHLRAGRHRVPGRLPRSVPTSAWRTAPRTPCGASRSSRS